MTASICSSTILRMKSACWPVVACGMVTKAVEGWPQPSTQDCHALTKLRATMPTAGMPALSRATMSWASHDVHLRGDPGRLVGIDMVPTAERRASGPEVAPVALERDVGVPPAQMFGHPVHGDIRPTGHVVVQADSLALQAGQARGWGHLEIYSIRGGRHDLHLHGVSPLR